MKFSTGENIRHRNPELKCTAEVSVNMMNQNAAVETPLKITTTDHAKRDFTQTFPTNGEAIMSREKVRSEVTKIVVCESPINLKSQITSQIPIHNIQPRSAPIRDIGKECMAMNSPAAMTKNAIERIRCQPIFIRAVLGLSNRPQARAFGTPNEVKFPIPPPRILAFQKSKDKFAW